MFVVGGSRLPLDATRIASASIENVERAEPGQCFQRWDYAIEWDEVSPAGQTHACLIDERARTVSSLRFSSKCDGNATL
jgi:hypothetical protein